MPPTAHSSSCKLPTDDQDGYRQKRKDEEGEAGESGRRNGKCEGQRREFLPDGQAGKNVEYVQRWKSTTECQRKGHKSSQLSKSRQTESPCGAQSKMVSLIFRLNAFWSSKAVSEDKIILLFEHFSSTQPSSQRSNADFGNTGLMPRESSLRMLSTTFGMQCKKGLQIHIRSSSNLISYQ